MTLVISETLRHGIEAGVRVAIAPIITDLPIVAVSVFFIASLSEYQAVLGVISLTGAVLLLYMAYEYIAMAGYRADFGKSQENSLRKGILVNMLSPNPYLFWLSVGAPLTSKAISESTLAVILFMLGFYLFLIGSKMALAVLVGRSRSFLQGEVYLWTMRLLGLLLGVFAFLLLRWAKVAGVEEWMHFL